MTKTRTITNRRKGAVIAETAAAWTIMIPLFFLVLFVALEASYAYFLKSSLEECAREGARELSIAYGQDPSVASSRSKQDQVLGKVRMLNVVNSPQQFDNPVFSTAADIPNVSVTVRYPSGQYGLPPFPNPDPLNIASRLVLTGSSTYRLQ